MNTEEKKEQISICRDKWIKIGSCEPQDKKEAFKTVKKYYELSALPPPKYYKD